MGHGPWRWSLGLVPGLAASGAEFCFPPKGGLEIYCCDDLAAICVPFDPNYMIIEKVSRIREMILTKVLIVYFPALDHAPGRWSLGAWSVDLG